MKTTERKTYELEKLGEHPKCPPWTSQPPLWGNVDVSKGRAAGHTINIAMARRLVLIGIGLRGDQGTIELSI